MSEALGFETGSDIVVNPVLEHRPALIERIAHDTMCYIDLQHYIHCKHTDAQFRCCWDPLAGAMNVEGDHNAFRAEIHSYARLCGACYRDTVEQASSRAIRPLGDSESEEVRDRVEFVSSAKVLEGIQAAGADGPFVVNEHHGGKMIACMFDGGIDHEGALREPREAFRNRPTHVGRNDNPYQPESTEPDFISAGSAWDVNCINDECKPTTATKEILLYFSECGHFNGLWCEELIDDDGGFIARCKCDQFDEKLATKQYAESAALCLLCRRIRVAETRELLEEMVRDISANRELALWPLTQRRPYREVR